ncbi:STAS domain-containing protein [Saccharopolyspora sp. CA-218241]|uniref:STAS domain-containing protein n=1 Tax=Saccharopolyspora sp. CA-218241 TaxID=3240027 RepID=UPI003D9826ED
MAVDVEWQGDAASVLVSGEIDMLSSPRLREAVDSALDDGPRLLVIDLSEVSLFASAGLSVLVAAHERATGLDVGLRIVAQGRAALRPIQATGLDRKMPVFETRAEALAG